MCSPGRALGLGQSGGGEGILLLLQPLSGENEKMVVNKTLLAFADTHRGPRAMLNGHSSFTFVLSLAVSL